MDQENGRGRLRAAIGAAALGLAVVAAASCAGVPAGGSAGGPAGKRDGIAVSRPSGPRFALELDPGPHYHATTTWFVFTLPVYPQVACWIESPDGRYLGTIYATGKGESGAWIGAPKGGRPEALPVWNARRSGAGPRGSNNAAGAGGGGADAVSAATPAGDTRTSSNLAASLPAGRYLVFLETNRSYDYNERYSRGNSGVCGQPSVVYRCGIETGGGPVSARFEPAGTGSVDGSDGSIREGLEGIDTALELFSRLALRLET